MEKGAYLKCSLYSIDDNFNIKSGLSYQKSILDSKKKYVDTVIVKEYLGGLSEILTGEVFDFSYIKVCDYYSKLLRRYVVKERIHRSVEPIHISLFSKNLVSSYTNSRNFEFADEDDINNYRNSIISKYGSVENYRSYLLYLKKSANDILNHAIDEYRNQKSLKKRHV